MPHYPICEGVAEYLYWEDRASEADWQYWQDQCAAEHQRMLEDYISQGYQDSLQEQYDTYLITSK